MHQNTGLDGRHVASEREITSVDGFDLSFFCQRGLDPGGDAFDDAAGATADAAGAAGTGETASANTAVAAGLLGGIRILVLV